MLSFFKRNMSSDEHEANQRAVDKHKPIEIGKAWGIEEELWDRNWGTLSGGESQRIALAAAVEP